MLSICVLRVQLPVVAILSTSQRKILLFISQLRKLRETPELPQCQDVAYILILETLFSHPHFSIQQLRYLCDYEKQNKVQGPNRPTTLPRLLISYLNYERNRRGNRDTSIEDPKLRTPHNPGIEGLFLPYPVHSYSGQKEK